MTQARTEFEQLNQQPGQSMFAEIWQFIIENKAWWMVPIVVTLAAVGVLVVLAGTGFAPFIYTLF